MPTLLSPNRKAHLNATEHNLNTKLAALILQLVTVDQQFIYYEISVWARRFVNVSKIPVNPITKNWLAAL